MFFDAARKGLQGAESILNFPLSATKSRHRRTRSQESLSIAPPPPDDENDEEDAVTGERSFKSHVHEPQHRGRRSSLIDGGVEDDERRDTTYSGKRSRADRKAEHVVARLQESGDDVLSLAGLGIQELPVSALRLSGIHNVDLSRNKIQILPVDFGLLSVVEFVDLSNNQLSVLPPTFTKLLELKVVILNNNRIRMLPGTLEKLQKLEELYVDNNLLGVMPDLSGLSVLTVLDVSHNDLRGLTPTTDIRVWGGASPNNVFASGLEESLEELYLNNNKIVTAPREIGRFKNLQSLDISNNAIISLPPEWGDLSNLRELDVSYNKIKEIPCEWARMTALVIFNWAGNRLDSPPPHAMRLGLKEIMRYLCKEYGKKYPDGVPAAAKPLDSDALRCTSSSSKHIAATSAASPATARKGRNRARQVGGKAAPATAVPSPEPQPRWTAADAPGSSRSPPPPDKGGGVLLSPRRGAASEQQSMSVPPVPQLRLRGEGSRSGVGPSALERVEILVTEREKRDSSALMEHEPTPSTGEDCGGAVYTAVATTAASDGNDKKEGKKEGKAHGSAETEEEKTKEGDEGTHQPKEREQGQKANDKAKELVEGNVAESNIETSNGSKETETGDGASTVDTGHALSASTSGGGAACGRRRGGRNRQRQIGQKQAAPPPPMFVVAAAAAADALPEEEGTVQQDIGQPAGEDDNVISSETETESESDTSYRSAAEDSSSEQEIDRRRGMQKTPSNLSFLLQLPLRTKEPPRAPRQQSMIQGWMRNDNESDTFAAEHSNEWRAQQTDNDTETRTVSQEVNACLSPRASAALRRKQSVCILTKKESDERELDDFRRMKEKIMVQKGTAAPVQAEPSTGTEELQSDLSESTYESTTDKSDGDLLERTMSEKRRDRNPLSSSTASQAPGRGPASDDIPTQRDRKKGRYKRREHRRGSAPQPHMQRQEKKEERKSMSLAEGISPRAKDNQPPLIRCKRYESDVGELVEVKAPFVVEKTRQKLLMAKHIHLERTVSFSNFYEQMNLPGVEHSNFVGCDKKGKPLLVSVFVNGENGECEAIIRSRENTHVVKLKDDESSPHPLHFLSRRSRHLVRTLQESDETLQGSVLRLCNDVKLRTELLTLDKMLSFNSYSFGVLNLQKGQKTAAIYSRNRTDSRRYLSFLDAIGKRVRLKGYHYFHGGLDTAGGTTGGHSVASVYDEQEIMFHVASLVPESKRKDIISQDYVVIVFVEGSAKFQPSKLQPSNNRVYIVVKEVKGKKLLRTCSASSSSVERTRRSARGIEQAEGPELAREHSGSMPPAAATVPTVEPEHPPGLRKTMPASMSKAFYHSSTSSSMNASLSTSDSPTTEPDISRADSDTGALKNDMERLNPEERYYQVEVVCCTGMPSFGPRLPPPSFTADRRAFRNWLLCKCINAERAVYTTSPIKEAVEERREMLIQDICQQFHKAIGLESVFDTLHSLLSPR